MTRAPAEIFLGVCRRKPLSFIRRVKSQEAHQTGEEAAGPSTPGDSEPSVGYINECIENETMSQGVYQTQAGELRSNLSCFIN
jgi:hypothetical protein